MQRIKKNVVILQLLGIIIQTSNKGDKNRTFEGSKFIGWDKNRTLKKRENKSDCIAVNIYLS